MLNTELSGVVVHKAKVVWLFTELVVWLFRYNAVWLFTELKWCGCSQS